MRVCLFRQSVCTRQYYLWLFNMWLFPIVEQNVYAYEYIEIMSFVLFVFFFLSSICSLSSLIHESACYKIWLIHFFARLHIYFLFVWFLASVGAYAQICTSFNVHLGAFGCERESFKLKIISLYIYFQGKCLNCVKFLCVCAWVWYKEKHFVLWPRRKLFP